MADSRNGGRPLEGINVALLTPFDEAERVDEDALAALVEDQVEHGIHGLFVNGSTGECTSQTPEERRRNVEVVKEAAGGRASLIVHVGSMSTREAVDHAEHAADQGADCVSLISPWYEPLSEQEIEEHVRAVASAGVPVMLYNNPDATGWSVSPELVAHLAERIEGFRYLKDTAGDPRRLFQIRELCGDRIGLLNGQDTLMVFLGLPYFTNAAVWGAPNATPRACMELWRRAVEHPDPQAVHELWSAFYPVNRFFESEGYPSAVKAGARLRGVKVGPTRRPNLPLPEDRVQVLSSLVERLDAVLDAARV